MKSENDLSSGFSSADWGGGSLFAATCNIPNASVNSWSFGSVFSFLGTGLCPVGIATLSSSLVCDTLLS
jgi:hypothetical protein